VFRRKANPSSPDPAQPEWRERFDRSRDLIRAQSPPPWMIDRLDALDGQLVAAEADHDRIGAALVQLDLDRATRELKDALRSQGPHPAPESERLIAALQARYESIHELTNKRAAIRRGIDAAIIDIELLAARSVELGASADRWQLDATAEQLRLDLDALALARRELADL
jgi:hypothetical protein